MKTSYTRYTKENSNIIMSFDHLRWRCPWPASQTSLRVYARVAITVSWLRDTEYGLVGVQYAMVDRGALKLRGGWRGKPRASSLLDVCAPSVSRELRGWSTELWGWSTVVLRMSEASREPHCNLPSCNSPGCFAVPTMTSNKLEASGAAFLKFVMVES